MHYVLIYDYAPDYLERRTEFRDAHLQLAWESHERGEFQLGGVLADPIDSALLWFVADSPAVVEQFVARDPYVQGIVILGLGQSESELAASFALAAKYPLVKGFAVGRTIHAGVGAQWMAGQMDDATAAAQMAQNYMRMCDYWDQARKQGGK